MDNGLPVRQPSLADQVYTIMMKEISAGTYPAGALLPSENQLAEKYNVSRPTIRAAFARLVERGYVKRQRGVGTYIADRPSIANPLYQFIDIRERISARGFTPGFMQLKTDIIKADDQLSKTLEVPIGSNILNIQKEFTADGNPIILFINYIPEWVYIECLSTDQVLEPGTTEPFFEFFANQCHHKVKYLASTIKPEIVQNIDLPEEFLHDNSCNTLLIIEDIGYNDDDTPLFFSIEHLVREASAFHIIRYVDNI
jgi:GntR family transcriptional regulator, N-acetylglucosamine utilization regulator